MLIFVVCANELPYCRHLMRQGLSLFTLMSSPYLPDILVADHGVNRGEKDLSICLMIFLHEVSLLLFLNKEYTDEWQLGRHLLLIKWRISIMSYFTQRSRYLKKIMNYLFLCDNSVIHKSEKIKSFIQDSGGSIITLTPYSLCLNPTEHLIGVIK